MTDEAETNTEDTFRGYGNVKVIESTNKSLNIHIPASVRDDLGLGRGQTLHVEANIKTRQILYTFRVQKAKVVESE